MNPDVRTWQQLLSRVALDPRPLPEAAHQVLAESSDAGVRAAWASRRDLPAVLLEQRVRIEDDRRVQARLVAQPDLSRSQARELADVGGRWTSLAFALRRDCPDREGAARVADTTAGAAGLRALEVLVARAGPLPDGRRHTRRALLEVLGRGDCGRDLAVLPQACSRAELGQAAEAIVRAGLPPRRLVRYVSAAEHPDAGRLVDAMASSPPRWDSSLPAWATVNAGGRVDGGAGRRVVVRLAATARTRRLRDHLGSLGVGEVLSELLANPLVSGAERTRLVGTASPVQLTQALDTRTVLHGADDLELLRSSARRNGREVATLHTAADVDRVPAAAVLGRGGWSPTARAVDRVSVTARLALLDMPARETVLALLDDWDGTLGELVEVASLL